MKTLPPTSSDTPWTYYPDPTRPRRQRVTNVDRLNRRNSLKQPQRNLAPIGWWALAAGVWVIGIAACWKFGIWLAR